MTMAYIPPSSTLDVDAIVALATQAALEAVSAALATPAAPTKAAPVKAASTKGTKQVRYVDPTTRQFVPKGTKGAQKVKFTSQRQVKGDNGTWANSGPLKVTTTQEAKKAAKKGSRKGAQASNAFHAWLIESAPQRASRKEANGLLAKALDSSRPGWRGASNRDKIWTQAQKRGPIPQVKN